MAAQSSNNGTLDSYLVLVPRGLQYAARESITKQLSEYDTRVTFVGEANADEDGYACRVTDLLQAQQEMGKKKNIDIQPCFSLPVGTTPIPEDKRNVSIGYARQTKPIVACPGVLLGVVWVQIATAAPVDIIATRLRVIGPLLALINIWDNTDMEASQTLEEAVDSVKKLVASEEYPFPRALGLWQKHVQSAWNLSEDDLKALGEKMKGREAVKYRLSMMRSDSENFKYTRQEFLTQVPDFIVPPQQREAGQAWEVDLTNFDLEVVLLMHSKALVVGLALRPYQHLNVKSFAKGTVIPPDVSPPVLPSEVLAKVIRLRPTTAHLLLELAQVESGDVVLDPCAGVGTIPVEVCFHKSGAVGLGGDLVLTPDALGPIATKYSRDAHRYKTTIQSSSSSCADLMSWDAAMLPLRDASVDAVISDLPFGQQCLSKSKVDALLPLMFSEMARVLRPNTGRIVLLCGTFASVVRALQQLNSNGAEEKVIETPLDSVFPANIGGIMAWVVVAKRGSGKPAFQENFRARARKATGKRERIEKQRAGDKKCSKKRSDFQS